MPTAKAGAKCRVPVPSPPPRHGGRRGRWGQARLVGAGETGGGRRGWWGLARPMGAVSLRPYARARQHQALGKPPGQIPSQQLKVIRHGKLQVRPPAQRSEALVCERRSTRLSIITICSCSHSTLALTLALIPGQFH